jgi:predicted Holliday junction resolvase-like endonuclease
MASEDTQVEQLKQQLNLLKQDYEQRIQALEKGLLAAQQTAKTNEKKLIIVEEQAEEAELASDDTISVAKNVFNPEISLILDGRYANYQNNPEDYHLTGYSLGGESGLFSEGLSLGESELTLSANVDQLFYGKITLAFADEDGGTEICIEEAFAQTPALSVN